MTMPTKSSGTITWSDSTDTKSKKSLPRKPEAPAPPPPPSLTSTTLKKLPPPPPKPNVTSKSKLKSNHKSNISKSRRSDLSKRSTNSEKINKLLNDGKGVNFGQATGLGGLRFRKITCVRTLCCNPPEPCCEPCCVPYYPPSVCYPQVQCEPEPEPCKQIRKITILNPTEEFQEKYLRESLKAKHHALQMTVDENDNLHFERCDSRDSRDRRRRDRRRRDSDSDSGDSRHRGNRKVLPKKQMEKQKKLKPKSRKSDDSFDALQSAAKLNTKGNKNKSKQAVLPGPSPSATSGLTEKLLKEKELAELMEIRRERERNQKINKYFASMDAAEAEKGQLGLKPAKHHSHKPKDVKELMNQAKAAEDPPREHTPHHLKDMVKKEILIHKAIEVPPKQQTPHHLKDMVKKEILIHKAIEIPHKEQTPHHLKDMVKKEILIHNKRRDSLLKAVEDLRNKAKEDKDKSVMPGDATGTTPAINPATKSTMAMNPDMTTPSTSLPAPEQHGEPQIPGATTGGTGVRNTESEQW